MIRTAPARVHSALYALLIVKDNIMQRMWP